jgi:hypothetical protein
MHNEAVNGHYHVSEDGITYYHVHPYDHHENSDSPLKDHTHSKVESVIYLSYTHPLFILSSIFCFIVYSLYRKIDFKSSKIFAFSLQESFDSSELRAPPAL